MGVFGRALLARASVTAMAIALPISLIAKRDTLHVKGKAIHKNEVSERQITDEINTYVTVALPRHLHRSVVDC